ncbi:MAG: hypothetical protein GY796_22060 [Chloroflexi bacterium]|nr:hypothetical protein [Chloroflexota bacterium]
MKVEYLPSGSPDCPLIRIFGTSRPQFGSLQEAANQLATGVKSIISTDELFGTDMLGNCRLILMAGDDDNGPAKTSDQAKFVWSLTREGWAEVANLVGPFADNVSMESYQWIGGENVGEISVVVSYSAGGIF